jgi:hypothetical protein
MKRKLFSAALSKLSAALAVTGCMLFLSVGGAKADTVFDVSGPVTGQVTVNTTTGALVSKDIKVPGFSSDLTNIVAFQTPPVLFSFTTTNSLVGHPGTMALTLLITSCNVRNPISCTTALLIPSPFAPAAVPFPAAALQLFISGLVLVLLGWRRKKKTAPG